MNHRTCPTIRFASLAFVIFAASMLTAQQPLLMSGSEPKFEPARYAHLKLSEEQLNALHDIEIAQYRFVTWLQFEYPTQLRSRDNDIAVVQAEVQSLQRRIAEYNRFNVWVGGGNPQFETVENLRLALIAAQKRLDFMQYDRGLSLQNQSLEYRVRQQAVEAARQRFRNARP